MNFNLEEYCSDNGLDYETTLRGFELFLRNNMQQYVYGAVGQAFNENRELMKSEIIEALSSATLVSGKAPKAASGGKSKNPDYAPHREQIICTVQGFDLPNERVKLNFVSTTQQPYGFFEHQLILSQDELCRLFYNVEPLNDDCDPDKPLEYDWDNAIVLDAVSRVIPDCSDILRNYTNVVNYLFTLDVKRKQARTGTPIEVLSILPCGVVNNVQST